MPFLTARWSNLVVATFPIAPEIIAKRLPPGVEPDVRDGCAFVSIVAFDFSHLRALGIPWPLARSFPEINLRFYVRHGKQRGVMFERELVSSTAIACLANTFFGESFRAIPIRRSLRHDEFIVEMVDRFDVGGRTNRIRAVALEPQAVPKPGSDEHFFLAHYWGFGKNRRGDAVRFRVEHEPWKCLRVDSYFIDVDWAGVYGAEWGVLSGVTPCSVIVTPGSAVAVHRKIALRQEESHQPNRSSFQGSPCMW
jgi:hypothetical protein